MSTKPRARTQNQVLSLSIMLFSFNQIASFIHYSLSLSGQPEYPEQYMGRASGSCFLTRNNEGIGMMMLKGILKITDTLPMLVFL